MARPKNPDPNVPVTIRIPQSVLDIWEEAAKRNGKENAKEWIEFKLIMAAKGG